VDRDWNHWYYGAGIQHWNVRGRNERIFAGGVFGYNPWASFSYSNPWIGEELQLFTNTEIRVQRYQNKNILTRGSLPAFDENHFAVNQVIGKRLDPYRNIWTQFGFQYVYVTDPTTGLTASSDGIDRIWYAGIGASHDTRDYKDYPMSGANSGVALQKKGLGFGDVDYVSYNVDIRYYQPIIAGTTIGARVFTRLVSGPVIPEYDNVFFGFSERIRGRFKQRIEGQNILGASVEWRIPVISPTELHFEFIPIKQFRDWRFGTYLAAFMDAGTVWNKHERVNFDHIPSGYGAGVHILLPYGFVFRLEYAWNDMGDGQPIYDLQASF
jgi:outer membrane protein assembly factor BamA